jgi:hypothetical protein
VINLSAVLISGCVFALLGKFFKLSWKRALIAGLAYGAVMSYSFLIATLIPIPFSSLVLEFAIALVLFRYLLGLSMSNSLLASVIVVVFWLLGYPYLAALIPPIVLPL